MGLPAVVGQQVESLEVGSLRLVTGQRVGIGAMQNKGSERVVTGWDQCFVGGNAVQPRTRPSRNFLEVAPEKMDFESRAFAALFRQKAALGIEKLWRCSGYRVDGYVVTTAGETILLEMKESLRWGATTSAGFQFLAARSMLQLPQVRRGIVVFERLSAEWDMKEGGAWAQFAREVHHVRDDFLMGALQVQPDGSLHVGGGPLRFPLGHGDT